MKLNDLIERMIKIYEFDNDTVLSQKEVVLVEKSFLLGLHYGQKFYIENDLLISINRISDT